MLKTSTVLAVFVCSFGVWVPASAQDVVPVRTVKAVGTEVVVSNAGGAQLDPRVSGSLMVYTDQLSWTILYFDIPTGATGAVPKPSGYADSLADVLGGTIVFKRTTLTGTRAIFAFEVASGVLRELDPLEGSFREYAAIGGRVVAWQEVFSPVAAPEVIVHDLDTAATVRLSDDAVHDLTPAVSPDGRVVAWSRCFLPWGDGCQIAISTRAADGTWSQPFARTPHVAAQLDKLPSTNGTLVTWHRENGESPELESDVYWGAIAGGPESRLAFPGTLESNPEISGTLISYQRYATAGAPADLFVYDVATGVNYQITDTPDRNEALSDMSVGEDGTVYLVWVSQGATTNFDVYAFSFRPLDLEPAYTVTPLFQQDRSYKAGSVVPLRLQILDATGANRSASDVIVTATGLLQKDSTAPAVEAEDAGNANPEGNFRYDAGLQGYVFNLSTKGLAVGTWELLFTVGGDAGTYRLTFSLR